MPTAERNYRVRAAEVGPSAPTSVAVWDRPLRACHWAIAIFVLIAWFTPNTFDGLHRLSGYILMGLVGFRLAWGVVGTRHARFRTLLPKLRASPSYLWGLRKARVGRYMGLNPAGAAVLVALLTLLTLSTVTGAMQVTVTFFGVWWVEDTHAYVSHAVIAFAAVHVIGVVLMSVLQQENLILAMITGRKRHRYPNVESTVNDQSKNVEEFPLGRANRGFTGVVRRIVGHDSQSALSDQELESRLIELGFNEGVRVEVLHEGLLGRDPIAVRVDNITIALRRREAMAIIVI